MGFKSKIEHTCDICGFHQVVHDSYPPPSGSFYGETRSFTQIPGKTMSEYDLIVCSKCLQDSLSRPLQPPCPPESRTIWKGW